MKTTLATKRCTACPAEIIFVITTRGRRIPLDPDPNIEGNVRLIDGVAHVVGNTIDLFDATDDGLRYMPHHATCPGWSA